MGATTLAHLDCARYLDGGKREPRLVNANMVGRSIVQTAKAGYNQSNAPATVGAAPPAPPPGSSRQIRRQRVAADTRNTGTCKAAPNESLTSLSRCEYANAGAAPAVLYRPALELSDRSHPPLPCLTGEPSA